MRHIIQLTLLVCGLLLSSLALAQTTGSSASCTKLVGGTYQGYTFTCCKKSRVLNDSVDWHLYSCPSDYEVSSECTENTDIYQGKLWLGPSYKLKNYCDVDYHIS